MEKMMIKSGQEKRRTKQIKVYDVWRMIMKIIKMVRRWWQRPRVETMKRTEEICSRLYFFRVKLRRKCFTTERLSICIMRFKGSKWHIFLTFFTIQFQSLFFCFSFLGSAVSQLAISLARHKKPWHWIWFHRFDALSCTKIYAGNPTLMLL